MKINHSRQEGAAKNSALVTLNKSREVTVKSKRFLTSQPTVISSLLTVDYNQTSHSALAIEDIPTSTTP